MTPIEARLAATAMACLTLLALFIAATLIDAQESLALPAMFIGLSCLGMWQVMHFSRIAKAS